MLNICNIENQIVDEIKCILNQMNENAGEELCKRIQEADKIFLAAAGRSRLMLLGFGMRLMHLGFKIHIVGDVTTPAITDRDLLIIASGSGETGSLVNMASKAKKLNAKIVLITTNVESSIAKLADSTIKIPASTPKNQSVKPISIQPGASLFEQSLLIYLDSFILGYMNSQNVELGHVMIKHANLE